MLTVEKIWMDGTLVAGEDARVSVLTHALHYGSGAFEGIRCYKTQKGSAIFRLREHLDRLVYSGKVIGLSIKYSVDQLIDACRETVKANKLDEAYLRPIAFYGHDTLGVPPRQCPTVVAIAAWKWGAYVKSDSPKVQTARYCRVHPKSVVCDAKVTGHYVNSLLAVREAHAAGFDEALLLDFEGNVAECSGENVFAVKGGKLYTPPLGNILAGITRATVIELARELKYPVEEKKFDRAFLASADEAFMTGTAAEVTPICVLDDTTISKGAGPVTAALKKVYGDVIRGKSPAHQRYLTYV